MRKYLGDIVDSEEFKHLFVVEPKDPYLHKCIKMIPKYPTMNDYLEEYLKSCNSQEVNEINYYRETPLYLATVNDCYKKTVECLIKAGVDINLDVYDSIPALHNSVGCCAVEILKVLIEAKANVNLEDSDGHTALHYAVDKRSIVMIEILIAAGIDVNVQDLVGKTALHYALECFYPKKLGKEIVKMLINAGANVNLQDVDGRVALHYTCSKKVTRALIDAGANLNLCNNCFGDTPLQEALDIGAKGMAKILITANADVYNIKNKKGLTAYDMMDEEMKEFLHDVDKVNQISKSNIG